MNNISFQKKVDFIKSQRMLRFYSHTVYTVNEFFHLIKDEKILKRFKEEEKLLKNETIANFRKLEKLNKYLGLENIEKSLPVYCDETHVWIGVNFFHILIKNTKSNKKILIDDNGSTTEL